MSRIKPLFEGINEKSIPKSIKDYYTMLYGSIQPSAVNSLGLTFYYYSSCDCYILNVQMELFQKTKKKGILNEERVPLSKEIENELFTSFGKGFRQGYSNFLAEVTNNGSVFQVTDKVKAHKVFSKIVHSDAPHVFTYYKVEPEVIKSKTYDTQLTNELMFNNGKSWGEVYNAWEIVLNNVTVFKPLFDEVSLSFHQDIADQEEEIEIPPIELKTQKEQIRLLYELGVIDFLREKYPNKLNSSNNQIAVLLSQILKLERTSVQPTLNALLSNNSSNKNYPKETEKTKAIIRDLNLPE